MASFQFSYLGNSGNIVINVKEQGQSLERFVSLSGNTVYFNAIQDNVSHTYEVKFTDNNCVVTKTFQFTCSLPCTAISGLTITGNSSVNPNARSQPYSISFTGTTPTNIQWSISGQGTSFVGNSSAATVYINFGSSGNALLSASIVDCFGTTKTSSVSINQTATCTLNVSLTSPSCN